MWCWIILVYGRQCKTKVLKAIGLSFITADLTVHFLCRVRENHWNLYTDGIIHLNLNNAFNEHVFTSNRWYKTLDRKATKWLLVPNCLFPLLNVEHDSPRRGASLAIRPSTYEKWKERTMWQCARRKRNTTLRRSKSKKVKLDLYFYVARPSDGTEHGETRVKVDPLKMYKHVLTAAWLDFDE